MKTLLLFIATIFSFTFLAPQLAIAQNTFDDNRNAACAAFNSNGTCADETGDRSFTDIWNSVINIATFAVGLVSVLFIVIGGLRYVLSSGDSQATASAKNTILYAVIGLIIAIIARAIIIFVLDRV